MPWQLQQHDGKWCVVKEGASSPVPGGCHPDRASAIKHQRALYANESRVASMYDELDAHPDTVFPPVEEPLPVKGAASELVKIEIGKENEALTASMMAHMERMSERQSATDQALVAALQAIGQRDNVFHVPSPEMNFTVPPAEVTVNVPPAEVNVSVPPAENHFHAPDVNVNVEAPPPVQKTVTFERDPLTHELVSAEVVET